MASHHHHQDDHDHDHDGHDHSGHDHSDETSPALQTMIYQQIEFDKVTTLNESERDTGRKVIEKTWQQRLDAEPRLVSDADEQLLMFVPFAGALKLHAILIRASTSSSCPRTLKIFQNREDLDFSSCSDVSPTQTLEISQTNDVQEIPVKRAAFGNTYSLTLFVEDNFGDDCTEIFWIGFKGDFAKLNREPFEVLYEKAANPKDHEMVAGIGERGALPGERHGM